MNHWSGLKLGQDKLLNFIDIFRNTHFVHFMYGKNNHEEKLASVHIGIYLAPKKRIKMNRYIKQLEYTANNYNIYW